MMKNKTVRGIVTGALAICAFAWTAGSALASTNVWYDKYVTADNAYGDSYYQSDDSSTLAWGESYVLESYLDLYGLTKSTSWLDKFTTHTDTVIASADDYDGDGYLGWSTYRYSPKEDANGDFEQASSSDATLPASWTRFQSSSTTAKLTTTNDGGSNGVVITTSGTLWSGFYQQLSYAPNQPHRLTANIKTSAGGGGGQVFVLDVTTGTKLATVSAAAGRTDWGDSLVSSVFTMPPAGHDVRVYIEQKSLTAGGSAWFDNVQVSGQYPYMVHDGVIGTAIAEFVRLVHQTPSLQAAYQTKATSYQNFLQNEIVPRWENSSSIGNTWDSISGTVGTYTTPLHYVSQGGSLFGEGDILPYNQSLAFSNLQLVLYDVNGNATYLDRATRNGQYFKNGLVLNGTAYKWKYMSNSGSSTIEDTSHGNFDLNAAGELFRHGIVFTGTDMERFTSTYRDVMWNGNATTPIVYYNVDGSNQSTSHSKTLMVWPELVQFSKDSFAIAAEQFRSYTPAYNYELKVLSAIMKWDRSKIVNQGFELKTSFDATEAAQWSRQNSTSSTMYLDSANAYEGQYGLAIKSDGSGTYQNAYQSWEEWLPSTSYTLSFMEKTDGSAAGGKVYVKDETAGTILATVSFNDTTWTAKSVTFTSPSSTSHVVRTYITNDSPTVANGKAFVDNIKIKATADSW